MRSLVLATLGVFAFPVTATALRQAAIAYPPSGPAPSAAIRAIAANRTDAARALLDQFASTHRAVLAQQYVHAFRALASLLVGNCVDATAEIHRAPDPGRPMPQAIRGACASKAGRHAEAVALRDSVLTHPLADPLSWPMIVARGVALRIH